MGMLRITTAKDIADVKAMMDAAGSQTINIPQIKKNKNAEDTAAIFNSREYRRKLQGQIDTLKSRLHPDQENPDQPPVSRKDKNQNNFLMPDERIYLFVSSSMPASTLKNYASDLDKLRDPNIVMVMRGFVNGIRLIKPTLEFIDGILIKDPNCDPANSQCDAYQANITIDPVVFSRYGIETVPAIVYARGVNKTETGQGATDNIASDAFLVSGDMSLDYALELIGQKTQSSQINNILNKLRRGFY
ncbi:MAG: type-F conjugative transfer system pilin assembly protein TrbC [Desulfosalsimonadaceae bacterium]